MCKTTNIIVYEDDYGVPIRFHRRDAIFPIIEIVGVTRQEREYCRILYFQSPGAAQPFQQRDIGLTNQQRLYDEILAILYGKEWQSEPDYFISEQSFFITTPIATLYGIRQETNTRFPFRVMADEMRPSVITESGAVIETQTMFDVALSIVDTQEHVVYFKLDEACHIEKEESDNILKLVYTQDDWAMIFACQRPKGDRYGVSVLEDKIGFAFKVIDNRCDTIWCKLGWINVGNAKEERVRALKCWV